MNRWLFSAGVAFVFFPLPSSAFFHFTETALASGNAPVIRTVSSEALWHSETPAASANVSVQASASTVSSGISSLFREQQSSPPPLFIPEDPGEQSVASGSVPEVYSSMESANEEVGDLVEDPIFVQQPRGNALLLTAQELQTALTRPIQTRSHLEDYVKALIQSDKQLRSVEIGESGVRMLYKQRAGLFGFLPLSYTLDTTVDAYGKVHMGKPWWLFLASDSARGIEEHLQVLVIEDKLILGNLLKIQEEEERRVALIGMLNNLLRRVYQAQAYQADIDK